MTMEAMVKCLTDRGFEVEKEYHSAEKLYSFRIAKDGCSVTKLFKYPDNSMLVAKAQNKFLEKITRSHWTKYTTYKQHTSYEFKVTEALGYIHHDIDLAGKLYYTQLLMYELINRGTYIPKIKKVIFNDPATIVFWSDNTKTVVKCQENDMGDVEIFDPEKGLAMAISKKVFGNKGNYYNSIRKWTDAYVATETEWEAFARHVGQIFNQVAGGDES